MPKLKLTFRLSIIALAFIGGASAATIWLIDRASAVYTSDARVRANMVTISSDIAGRVVDLSISAGDRVKVGDVLARLDDREARLAIAALTLEVRSLEAEVEREKLRASLSRTAGTNRVSSREAALAAARADLLGVEAQLEISEGDFERTTKLKASGLVTQAMVDRASANLESARQQEVRARAAIAQSEADIGEARAEAGEAGVIARDVEALSLRAHALRQQIALRKVELSRHSVTSPIAGVVDEVFADRGEHVSAGARIALVHDGSVMWIEANIKETEIARIADGARVEARLDAAPDRVCLGRVDRIRDAAVAEFALIPNANPTGVFTKITQRVPVRIVPDETCREMRPGAMATLRIATLDGDR
jgi:membrane fusion protein (multidrug efflux system)